MPQASVKTKSARIDVRVSARAKDTLQQAARQTNRTVSEFLLEAGLAAAQDALADRRLFTLDAKRWQQFQALLDRPPQAKPRLAKLLREPSRFAR
ncbi:MAG: DUF1778 domain-containing protein [Rhodospirillales bacterium]|nr:DUF1778 domain-containing protein [Rhodospirillales bacterium]